MKILTTIKRTHIGFNQNKWNQWSVLSFLAFGHWHDFFQLCLFACYNEHRSWECILGLMNAIFNIILLVTPLEYQIEDWNQLHCITSVDVYSNALPQFFFLIPVVLYKNCMNTVFSWYLPTVSVSLNIHECYCLNPSKECCHKALWPHLSVCITAYAFKYRWKAFYEISTHMCEPCKQINVM